MGGVGFNSEVDTAHEVFGSRRPYVVIVDRSPTTFWAAPIAAVSARSGARFMLLPVRTVVAAIAIAIGLAPGLGLARAGAPAPATSRSGEQVESLQAMVTAAGYVCHVNSLSKRGPDPDGYVYYLLACDEGGHCIVQFSPSGRKRVMECRAPDQVDVVRPHSAHRR